MEEDQAGKACHLKTCSKSSREAKSEVAEPADSLDLGTEPPDLRNWFSSYAYQSPELTSSYCFQDSLVIDGECEDKSLHAEYSGNVEQCPKTELVCFRNDYPSKSSTESVQHLKVKVPEYSDSFLSEPPDIRNWFSSYEYESPTLDYDEIGGSLSSLAKNDCLEDDVMEKEKTWKSSTTKTLVGFIADTTHADGFVEFREHTECVKPETNSSKKDTRLKDQRSGQTAEPEKIVFTVGISCRVEGAEYETVDINPRHAATKMLALESPNEPTERACTATEGNTIEAESGSGWISMINRGKHGDSTGISKDTRRHKLLENGFTSTAGTSCKVNRRNGEEKKHEPTEKVVSRELEKGTRVKKALKEITNVCGSAENGVVAGKWRCPQRRKPDVGPPLKQLRLEKWVHRI